MGKELMDCDQVAEVLDAYALGALEKSEARGVELHVADCVRCWEDLSKAQRTAALLALSGPIAQAPERLEERIIQAAARERSRERPAARTGGGILSGLRVGWQAAAGGLAVLGIVSLGFAGFLQVQMNDLRNEKSDLEDQVQSAGAELEQQKQVTAVLSAADSQRVAMEAVSASDATVSYNWSRSATRGFLMCDGLPPLSEDEVFQVWFVVEDAPQSVATFESGDGTCLVAMDLSVLSRRPSGIGISKEKAPGAGQPTDDWLVYAHFD